MIQDLFQWAQELGPWGIFSFLVLCSFGLPIAKSLLLLLAGMLAQNDPQNVTGYLLAAVLGLHGGDFSLFLIGWIFDDRLLKLRLVNKIISEKKLEQARNLIAKHGLYSLVIIRLTPYIRGVCYLTLGSLKMSIVRFNTINILVCFVYSLFFFLPGYYMISQIENLRKISRYGNTLLGILFLILIAGFILHWQKKRRSS